MKRVEIKKWLMDQGVSQAEIARRLMVSAALVSMTIKGDRSSPRVLDALKAMGCPEDLLERAA